MTSKVFIIEELTAIRYDITPAEQYGEIFNIFPAQERRAGIFDTQFEQDVTAALKKHDFDPTLDYICATGSMTPVLLTVAAVACTYGQIKLLLFDSRKGTYEPKEIAPYKQPV